MSEHAFLSDVRLALVLTAARGLLDELRTSVVDESVHEKANELADALHAFEGEQGSSFKFQVSSSRLSPLETLNLKPETPFPGDFEQAELEQGGNPHDL